MSGIWPGEIKCVAMLTFDLDGVSSWIRRDPSYADFPSLMSMAEYGPNIATPRILDLLDKYDIKSSFYVPGFVAETHTDLVKEIFDRGHEIAHHGYMHEAPATMSKCEEEDVLKKGINILNDITGTVPIGYRSPSWELSSISLELLSRYNFKYDSSMMGDDAPYFIESESANGRLVEVPIHWVLDDAPNFVYAPSANRLGPMRNPEEVYITWAAEFEGLYKFGRSFNLTMHPQYIGRPGRLLMLEKLINYINTFDDVQFMRVDKVSDLWLNSHKG